MFRNQFSQKSPRALHVLNHGWWRLAVDASWRLAVGGPLGRFLRVVLSKKKKWCLKDRPGGGGVVGALGAAELPPPGKELDFKVPSQYLWEIVAEHPFKFGCFDHNVIAIAEPPKKARTRQSKQEALRKKKAATKCRCQAAASRDADSNTNVPTPEWGQRG